MTPQLFSIDHAPASLPYWQTIFDDLGRPPVRRIARVLGLSERSVYRYHQAGQAPRVVMLALFWLTRWGRSAVHTQATNDAVMAVTLVRGLNDRIAHLAGQLEQLQRLGHFGSANAPLLQARGPGRDAPSVQPLTFKPASGSDGCAAPATPAGHVDGVPPAPDARPGKLNSWPQAPDRQPIDALAGRGLDVGQGMPEAPHADGRAPPDRRKPGGRRRRPA